MSPEMCLEGNQAEPPRIIEPRREYNDCDVGLYEYAANFAFSSLYFSYAYLLRSTTN